jgi:hypothetical protein
MTARSVEEARMFFSKLARLIAIVAFVLGLFGILLGIAIAMELVGPYEAALARYTGSLSSGQVIVGGIFTIVIAVALGTLAEISFSASVPFDER